MCYGLSKRYEKFDLFRHFYGNNANNITIGVIAIVA